MSPCEEPSFFRTKQVRGRKRYLCCECHSEIAKGEHHQVVVGQWEEGTIEKFRCCKTCWQLRLRLEAEVLSKNGGCLPFSGMAEELRLPVYRSRPSVEEFYIRLNRDADMTLKTGVTRQVTR